MASPQNLRASGEEEGKGVNWWCIQVKRIEKRGVLTRGAQALSFGDTKTPSPCLIISARTAVNYRELLSINLYNQNHLIPITVQYIEPGK